MKLLVLDTSSAACSVALGIDDEVIVQHEVPGRGHADRLLADIDRLLERAGLTPQQLDGVACGHGPGSFTGVRIGVAAAQAIAWGADIPALGVSSLRVMAETLDAPRVVAAFDARMDQVYAGAYVRDGDGIMQSAGREQVCDPAAFDIEDDAGQWAGIGPGFGVHDGALATRLGIATDEPNLDATPHATALMRLALSGFANSEATSAILLVPNYIRDDVARPSSKPGPLQRS